MKNRPRHTRLDTIETKPILNRRRERRKTRGEGGGREEEGGRRQGKKNMKEGGGEREKGREYLIGRGRDAQCGGTFRR